MVKPGERIKQMRTHKNYQARVEAQLKRTEAELDDIWNREGFESRVEFAEGFQTALETAHFGFPVESVPVDSYEAGVQFGRSWLLTACYAKNCPKCKGKGEYSHKCKFRPWEKRRIVKCHTCQGMGFEGAQTISNGIVQNIQIIESEVLTNV